MLEAYPDLWNPNLNEGTRKRRKGVSVCALLTMSLMRELPTHRLPRHTELPIVGTEALGSSGQLETPKG